MGEGRYVSRISRNRSGKVLRPSTDPTPIRRFKSRGPRKFLKGEDQVPRVRRSGRDINFVFGSVLCH